VPAWDAGAGPTGAMAIGFVETQPAESEINPTANNWEKLLQFMLGTIANDPSGDTSIFIAEPIV
jgi:hypothetical protein